MRWGPRPGARVAETAVIPGEGRITGVEPDPRRAGAVRIAVDGRPRWTVGADAVLGVVAGCRLDEALLVRLETAADAEAAFRTLLRCLTRRGFARGDLGRRLKQRGHPVPAVDSALDRAQGLGLLDDTVFARTYMETRATRGRGPARVARDLGAMGVERGIIERTLAAWPASAAPEQLARELATKRVLQLKGLDRVTRRRRLVAFLARRGFTGSAVMAVVREVLGG
ncbi:MAG: regulatory protein RecX [Gemmatimonadales bacterium]